MTAFATCIYLNLYAQHSAIYYGLRVIRFLSEHTKSDQNLKFVLLKVTTSTTVIFIWESGIQTIIDKLTITHLVLF